MKNESSEETNKSEETENEKKEYTSLYLEQDPYIDVSVKKYKKKKKIFRRVMWSVLGLLIVCYLGGVFYFSQHFSSNTTLNGYDISYYDADEADKVIERETDSYSLTVRFKNGEEEIRTGDAGLQISMAESMQSLIGRQNPLIWFIDLFRADHYDVSYVVSYNEKDMRTLISNMDYMKTYNMEPSVNARVKMEDGEAVLVKDVTGTELKPENVYKVVFDALDAYETLADIEAGHCYIPASVTENSAVIAKGMKNAENFLSIEAVYDFDGYEIQIPREELSTLAYVDDASNIVISRKNVETYAEKFAKQYSTSYTDRDFKTHDGKKIKVYGGYYGWQLDPVKEAEELYELLCTQDNFMKEPACDHKGYAYGEFNDIGDTYVEIDLTDQHVYVYINGRKAYDTDCVSGNASRGMSTPGGLFGVTYMAQNVFLRGEGYETHVNFWMPFNGGIGMHDATWRRQFGGNIYSYDGSHGCINLPYSAAADIYSMIEPGMPVVCYWD